MAINTALCYWREDPIPGWTMLAFSERGDFVIRIARRLHRHLGIAIHLHLLEDEQSILWCTEDAARCFTPCEHLNEEDIRVTKELLRKK